jgi:hypothetical protein
MKFLCPSLLIFIIGIFTHSSLAAIPYTLGIDAEVGAYGGSQSYREVLSGYHLVQQSDPSALYLEAAPYLSVQPSNSPHRFACSYSYRQDWGTSEQLLRQFSRRHFAFNAQPFPLGLLMQTHRLTLSWISQLSFSWRIGLWSDYAWQRLGSRWSRNDDPRFFTREIPLREQLALVPWLSYRWSRQQRSLAAINYFTVKLDEFPDLSYRTFGLQQGMPLPSVLLQHHFGDFAREGSLALAASQRFFLPTDHAETYRRLRLGIKGFYPFAHSSHLEVSVQRFWDSYLISEPPHPRYRYDTGGVYSAGLGGNLLSHLSWDLTLLLRTDSHPAKNIGDFSARDVILELQWHEAPEIHEELRPRWLEDDRLLKRGELYNTVFP